MWQLQNNYAAVEGNGVKETNIRCAVVQQSDGEVQVVGILTLSLLQRTLPSFDSILRIRTMQ